MGNPRLPAVSGSSLVLGSGHLRFELDGLAVDDERTVAVVVDGLGRFLLGVDPGLHPLEDEQIVAVDEPRVGHPAFDIGKALL